MSKNNISKKQKLLAGICIPLAAAGVAAGVAGIFLTKKPSKPTQGDYKVSFYTDESSHFVDDTNSELRVYSGTTLDRIDKPAVESYRSHHIFTGWQDEKGSPVPGKYAISRDTKLTASFGNTLSGDYYTITFKTKSDESAVKLHGNVSVGVKKGYKFLMVNRPTAEWGDNYFENWQYYDESTKTYVTMDESTTITSNMVLYPKFTQAVTITWNAGDGGSIQRGSTTTRLSSGTKFGMFNQPQLQNSDTKKVFRRWCKDEKCLTAWSDSEVVTDNATAYAEWIDGGTTSEKYHTLQFVQNYETGAKVEVIFAPSTTSVVKTQSYWSDANKPDVYTDPTDFELDSWEFYDESLETPAWVELPEDHQFITSDTKYITKIRPVMVSSISSVTISGEQTVLPESTNDYYAVVNGTKTNSSVTQTVTWSLWYDKGCSEQVPSTVASINESTGVLTVKSLTSETQLYVKAVPTASGTTKTAVLPVKVQMPYVQSQKIWYHNGTQWFSISQRDGLCDDSTNEITATALNSSYGEKSQTLNKSSDFTYKIYIGRQLTELFDNFGYNWYGFNGQIDFGDHLKRIGKSFFENAKNFNKSLDLTYITEIGDSFLANATAFGTPEKTEEGIVYDSLITFGSGLTTIGNQFLMGCSNYNRKLNLPGTTASGIKGADLSIGEAFMYGCTNFNQDIEIPSNVVRIDDFFMYDCNAFTSTITVNNDVEESMLESSIYIIASSSSGADIYSTGFKVAGAYKTEFVTDYPDHNSDYSYRRIAADPAPSVTKDEFDSALTYVLYTDTYTGMNFTAESDMFGGTVNFVANSDGSATTYIDDPDVWGPWETSLGNSTSSAKDNNYAWKRYDTDGVLGEFRALDTSRYGDLYTILKDIPNHDYGTDWVRDEKTGKYVLSDGSYEITIEGTTFKFNASLEFDSNHKITMFTVWGDAGSLSVTLSNYGTTKMPTPKSGLQDTNFAQLTNGTSTTELTSDTFTYDADNGYLYLSISLKGISLPHYSTTTDYAFDLTIDDGVTGTFKRIDFSNADSVHIVDENGALKDDYVKSFDLTTAGTGSSSAACRFCCDMPKAEFANSDRILLVVPVKGEIKQSNIQVKCTPVVADNLFEECSWDIINEKCTALEAGKLTDTQFCSYFGKSSMDDFVGLSRETTINGLTYEFKVIGVKHDDLADGSGKAALTFAINTPYRPDLKVIWGPNSGTNKDYTNALMRTQLDKDVFSLFTSSMQKYIKTVTKTISKYNETLATPAWTTTTYSAGMFAFTATELGLTGSAVEGTKYDLTNPFASIGADFWLASPYTGETTNFNTAYFYDYAEGVPAVGTASIETEMNYVFGFCI